VVDDYEDFEAKYKKERERLTKLWEAYEDLEREFERANERVASLEESVDEKDRIIMSLKEVLEARDEEIRDLEIDIARLKKSEDEYQPKLNELSEAYRKEKDRVTKLFEIAEELDRELSEKRREVLGRDEWFQSHIGIFRNMCQALEVREDFVHKALHDDISDTKGRIRTILGLQEKDVDESLEDIKRSLATEKGPSASAQAVKVADTKRLRKRPKVKVVDGDDEDEPEEATVEQPEEKVEEKPEEAVATPQAETPAPKDDEPDLKELLTIPNVTHTIAKNLHSNGFSTVEQVSKAKLTDLHRVEGISPSSARKVRAGAQEILKKK